MSNSEEKSEEKVQKEAELPKKKRTIKNYEIVKRLGKGSYAVVYLAHPIDQPENLLTIKVTNIYFLNKILGYKI